MNPNKFNPKLLPILENRRWELIQKHIKFIKEVWKPYIEKYKNSSFYGEIPYQGTKIKLRLYIKDGIQEQSFTEYGWRSYPKAFVECLEDSELPLYIKEFESEITKRIIAGDKYVPATKNQEAIDIYRLNYMKLKRLSRGILLYNYIIEQHLKHLIYSPPETLIGIISLTINGRLYLMDTKDNTFIYKPEDFIHSFYFKDLLKDNHANNYQGILNKLDINKGA